MNSVSKTLWTCDSCYRGCLALSYEVPDDELCPLQMRTHWTSIPDLPKDDRDLMDSPFDQNMLEDFAEA